MSIFDRVFQDLVQRKKRISEGLLNCIPSPFPRFREVFPGIEQGKFLLFSANSKIGKTQIADDMCLYEPLFYAIEHDNVHIRWHYFSWEMPAEQKYRQFICHLLYRLSNGNVRIDTKQLRSVDANKPLSDDVLQLLQEEEYQRYIRYFEEHVTIIDDIRNPTGVKIYLEEYAEKNGKLHFTTKTFYDKQGTEKFSRKIFDYYEPDDPELYNIVIFDHISLISLERGLNLRDTIEMFSNKHLVYLRNRFNYTFVVIQQQAAAQESNENFKLDKLRPTADGLGDCKTTFRDADLFFGLYSPYRYKISEYLGYDIKMFKDNIRFLELIGGREGGGGNVCPLYFDGAVNFFKELPSPSDERGIAKVYSLLRSLRGVGTIAATMLSSKRSKINFNGKSSWYLRIFRRW
ncbi:replicative DNA helicase [uncultured phage cr108_1]|uniref:Replicative DNA helicase n=1 Tax=uncultured phage cr108_1 TaxID=2772069 RepID=A0A7M1RXD3_9CAUD|nr:replicative DNA helicase [uncultured phage cr108_1]QOR59018.1 replicative DNA helicase [uncultured phage cr108_1]